MDSTDLGAAIRRVREAQNLGRSALADRVGIAKETVRQIERGQAHPSLDTLNRLAGALNVSLNELVGEKSDIGRGAPPSRAPQLSSALIHEFTVGARGKWLDEERHTLFLREQHRPGSTAWADLTLHAAWMRQQAGDVIGAWLYIDEVEKQCVRGIERPDTHILSKIHDQRGWIAGENLGAVVAGSREFKSGLKYASDIGDLQTLSTDAHWLLRLEVVQAMTEADAWFGAIPSEHHYQQARALQPRLAQSLRTLWPQSCQFEPDSPFHYYLRWNILALLRPRDAQLELPNLRSRAKESNTERFVHLLEAQWAYSHCEEHWGGAIDLAKQAFIEFYQAAFPPGLASASNIWAKALANNGLRTRTEAFRCLDLWLVAMMLWPYNSHPLWRLALQGFIDSTERILAEHPSWVREYFAFPELDKRAREATSKPARPDELPKPKSVLSALHRIPFVTTQSPLAYLQHVLPPPNLQRYVTSQVKQGG